MNKQHLIPPLLVIITTLICGTTSVLACSMPQLEPRRFDRSQTILVGEITGYVDDVPLLNSGQTEISRHTYGKFGDVTAGITVAVNESLYSPEILKSKYEVFRFGLAPNCAYYGLGPDQLKEQYKVGQRVRIIAARASHVPRSSEPETGRLEVRFSAYDAIDASSDLNDSSYSDIKSEFDYSKYRKDLLGNPWFEVIKDLYRLDAATTRNERNRVLQRLTYFPRFCENCTFFLQSVFETYTSDKGEFDRFAMLVKKREMTDEEFQEFEKRRFAKR